MMTQALADSYSRDTTTKTPQVFVFESLGWQG